MADSGLIKCDACGTEVSKNDLPELRYGGGGAVPANDVPIYRMSIRPITRPEHGVGGAHFDLCRKCVQRLTNELEREPGDNLPPLPEPTFPGPATERWQFQWVEDSFAESDGINVLCPVYRPDTVPGRWHRVEKKKPICPCGATEYLEGSSAVYCSNGHAMNPDYIGFGPMYGDPPPSSSRNRVAKLIDRVKDRIAKWTFPGV